MQRLKLIISKKIAAFCEHCTLHGVYYLQSRRRGSRVVWATIIAAGIALCAVLSHMIWEKYTIDPFVTVVESTYYRSEQIPFPAVIICDPQPVYGPKTKNVSYILSSRGYNDTEIDDFYESFLDIIKPSYVAPVYVRKMHSVLQDLGFTIETLLEMFKKPCDVIMVTCRWRSKKYNCSDMFREVSTVIGHCCQFDIPYFRQFAPKNTTFTSGKEPSEALDITVDGVKALPNGTVKDGVILLYIFGAGNGVTMMDGSIALDASSYFDVNLQIFAIDSSADVKAMSLKTRKCVIPTDRGLGASFYQKCISTLIMRRVVNYCKCLPFMYAADDLLVSDYQNCTWERYLCIYSQLEHLWCVVFGRHRFWWLTKPIQDRHDLPEAWQEKPATDDEITYADMHSLIRMNDCYQNCDYVEYESKVDFIKKRKISGHTNESYSRVAIHYASNTCIKYRRELIYTWDQMLANLGGIFGLCLGGSIISIIEIVWFLIDLLVTTIYNFTGKTKLKPTEKKIAFVTVKEDAKKQAKNKDGCYKFVN